LSSGSSSSKSKQSTSASYANPTFADSAASDQFVCPSCTYHNAASVLRCEICGEPNPAAPLMDTSVDSDGVRAPIPHQQDQLIGGPTFPFPYSSDIYPHTQVRNRVHSTGAPIAMPANEAFSSSSNSSITNHPQINDEVIGVEWTCPSCTCFNQPYTTACSTCHQPHPLLFSQSSVPPPTPAGGWSKLFSSQPRWVCENCGKDNVPNLIRCNRCKAPNVHLLTREAQNNNQTCNLM